MLGSETGHVDLLVHQCMQSVWVLLLIAILGTNSANGHLRLGVPEAQNFSFELFVTD
jgi:hypothetical protein